MKIIAILSVLILGQASLLPAADLQKPFAPRFPQAMVFDQEQDLFYVGFLGGDPSIRNSRSFIGKVSRDLVEPIKRHFIVGLNAPLSLCLSGDFLVVADLNTVKFFQKDSGELVRTVITGSLQRSQISDVCSNSYGTVYASDFKNNAILKITPENNFQAKVVYRNLSLNHPRRIALDPQEQSLIISSWSTGDLYRYDLVKARFRILYERLSPSINGLETDKQGNIYLLDQAQGKLLKIDHQSQTLSTLREDIPQSGDLSWLDKDLVIPLSLKNDYLLYPLEDQA